MSTRLVFSFLVTMLALTACSTPENSFSTGKTSQESEFLINVPVDPVLITPILDFERQVSQVVPASGGILSVESEAGTKFSLEIPDGALVSDTLIKLTPVREVDGMPFGNNPLAVHLEPEGLHFYAFVTLSIFPAENIPIEEQILFSYQDENHELVVAPPVVQSAEIKIMIDHFSGYGVTRGLLADLDPVRDRLGGSTALSIQSRIAEILSKERQRQLLGGGDEGLDEGNEEIKKLFLEYKEQVVKPRIAAAGESCAAGRLAIETILSYERQNQLLGIDVENDSSFNPDIVNTVGDVCMKEEYEICKEDHVIHRIIPAWLTLERQSQLLGFSDSKYTDGYQGYIQKCLIFELQFHSEVNVSIDEVDGYDSIVDSRIKLQFSTVDWKIKGQAPLENTSFAWKEEGCNVTNIPGGGIFDAFDLVYHQESTSATDRLSEVSDFSLMYFPGITTESATVICDDEVETLPVGSHWTTMYLTTHEDEMNMDMGGFILENWEIFGDEYFAKKEWIKADSEIGVTEAGTFKLYHKPE